MKNYELRITNYKLLFAAFLSIFLGVNFLNAQSTSQSFPTAVTTNEISGQIKARDIGDSRSTAYFYTFNAVQGDVFVNVVTDNFNGDIDVFAVEGLKSLTKIVVYADSPSNETGRVIYLRKPEKLLLRIEGRSPNDDAATFRIKFAGSFQALSETDQTEQPKLPEVSAQNDSGIVVNSVGTIISVKPKPTPAPREVVAEKEVESGSVTGISVETEKKNEVVAEVVKPETGEIKEISLETDTKKEVVAEVSKSEKTEVKEISVETATEKEIVAGNQPKQPESSEKLEASITETAIENPEAKAETPKPTNTKTKKPRVKKPTEPNPLENVRLIVLFKDGTKIERPMSEVLRVNVDNKGMLTVVSKDGSIERHSILDVAKFTIE
jgi:hypothetical protein